MSKFDSLIADLRKLNSVAAKEYPQFKQSLPSGFMPNDFYLILGKLWWTTPTFSIC